MPDKNKDINTEDRWAELLVDPSTANTFEFYLIKAVMRGTEEMLKRLEPGFPALVRAERKRRDEEFWGNNGKRI